MSYATPIVIIKYEGEEKPVVKKSVMGALLPQLKRMRTQGIYLTAWIDKRDRYVRIYASQDGSQPKRVFKIGCSTNSTRSMRWIGRTCSFYRYGKRTEAGTVLENFSCDFSVVRKPVPVVKSEKPKKKKLDRKKKKKGVKNLIKKEKRESFYDKLKRERDAQLSLEIDDVRSNYGMRSVKRRYDREEDEEDEDEDDY